MPNNLPARRPYKIIVNSYLDATDPHRPQHARISPFEHYNLTKPHQRFICIFLSNLALACTLTWALKALRHLTLSADTAFPLLVEHSKADIRLNTCGERGLESFPTPPNDFESRA
jgi:hypothetical protein